MTVSGDNNSKKNEVLALKVTKLEMVVMLLINIIRKIDPNNAALLQAEKLLSHGG